MQNLTGLANDIWWIMEVSDLISCAVPPKSCRTLLQNWLGRN